jgi:hypothetical protein
MTFENLFGHAGAPSAADRFKTTNQRMNSGGVAWSLKGGSPKAGNKAMRARQRKLQNERLANHFTTQNNATERAKSRVQARARRGDRGESKREMKRSSKLGNASDPLW